MSEWLGQLLNYARLFWFCFQTKHGVTHTERERDKLSLLNISIYAHIHTCARTQVVDCIWYVLDAIASRQLSCYADQWMIVIFGMRIAFRCEQRNGEKRRTNILYWCLGCKWKHDAMISVSNAIEPKISTCTLYMCEAIARNGRIINL